MHRLFLFSYNSRKLNIHLEKTFRLWSSFTRKREKCS